MSLKRYSCPLCGAMTFYVPIDELSSYFFYMTPEGVKPTPRSEHVDPGGLDFGRIFCLGCSWYGTLEELEKANA